MISALFCSKVLIFCKIPETSPFSSVSFSCTLMVLSLAELESSFILALSKFSLINSTVFFSTMLLSLFLFSMSSSTLLLRKFTVLLRLYPFLLIIIMVLNSSSNSMESVDLISFTVWSMVLRLITIFCKSISRGWLFLTNLNLRNGVSYHSFMPMILLGTLLKLEVLLNSSAL